MTFFTPFFYVCLAGFPKKFSFRISDQEEFSKEYPEFVSRFLNFYGSYTLAGFGRMDGCELKMGSKIDRLQGITPIWRKTFTVTDSQYFIFYNQTSSKWELHEIETRNGFSSSITNHHLECKAGLLTN